jgi:hypothetical protein
LNEIAPPRQLNRYALLSMNRAKILGAYLLVAGIVQSGLYLAMSLPGDHLWLMYFDPRLALFFVEVTLKGPDLVAPWIFSW